MEKEDFEEGINLLDSLAAMIIALSGNCIVLQNAIRNTELEKDIHRNLFNVEDGEVLETLHRIGIYKYILSSGLEWTSRLENGK